MLILMDAIHDTHIVPMLDIRPMAAVHLVGHTRSFSLAAAALGTTQPTLSRLIAGAEARLGTALFRRGWSGAEPTPQGEIVLKTCDRGIAALDQAERALFPARGPHPGLRNLLRVADLVAVRAVVESGSTRLAAQLLTRGQPVAEVLVTAGETPL